MEAGGQRDGGRSLPSRRRQAAGPWVTPPGRATRYQWRRHRSQAGPWRDEWADASVKRGWYRGKSTSRPGVSGTGFLLLERCVFKPVSRQAGRAGARARADRASGASATRWRATSRATTESERRFSFLDGPITANNPMGVHHAWGRTYKDLYQRFHTMLGEKQRYQNGFDCQGLWIEVEVEKELGFNNKRDIEAYGVDRFVERCKERVAALRRRIRPSSRSGSATGWTGTTATTRTRDENNYTIWHFLEECHERGLIYKGHDVMPWCPRCGTGLSEHGDRHRGLPRADAPLARRSACRSPAPATRTRTCWSGRRRPGRWRQRRGGRPPGARPTSLVEGARWPALVAEPRLAANASRGDADGRCARARAPSWWA